jgi:ribose/xylose/arabinose/galactoside ABC-type transport system permease subunit
MVMGYLGNTLQWPFVAVILAALVASAICGAAAERMVTRLKMAAFIAMLAMM